MCLQNPRGYPYEKVWNFSECRTKFLDSAVHRHYRRSPAVGKHERRPISTGENHFLVNAKLTSAPPALRAGTSHNNLETVDTGYHLDFYKPSSNAEH